MWLASLSLLIAGVSAPQVQVKQGQTFIIELDRETCVANSAGNITFLGAVYQCTYDNKLIIGIDANQKSGVYEIEQKVSDSVVRTLATVTVRQNNFYRTYYRWKPSKPNKNRPDEVQRISSALRRGETVDPIRRVEKEHCCGSPLEKVKVTGAFGTRRIYRFGRKNNIHHIHRHNGVDLRAPSGTAVYSPLDGVVVLTGNFSAEGNMIIIYHGNGVYSLYMHLKDFYAIEEGDDILAGRLIAHSDNTGYSLGPHLHFAVKVNGAYVDPLQFLEVINQK